MNAAVPEHLSGLLEAIVAATTRIDGLWNLFLAVHIGLASTVVAMKLRPSGKRALGSRALVAATVVLVLGYGLFTYINANAISDAYALLKHITDVLREALKNDQEFARSPGVPALIVYLETEGWTTGWPPDNRLLVPFVTHPVAAAGMGAVLYFLLRQVVPVRSTFSAERAAAPIPDGRGSDR